MQVNNLDTDYIFSKNLYKCNTKVLINHYVYSHRTIKYDNCSLLFL